MRSSEKEKVKNLILELVSTSVNEDREEEINEQLDQLCPDPEWSDYIFWSDKYLHSDGEINIDALVEKIFSYQKINL